MATSPMMQGNPMMDEAQGATEEAQSFEVCISPRPDGTFEVTKEAKEEAPAGDQMNGTEGGEQVAQTIDEALDLARQLLQDDTQSADAQVMKGYQKNAPAPGKPSVGKVFGE